MGLKDTTTRNRVINYQTEDELEQLLNELDNVISNTLIDPLEDSLDNEYYRIYITYNYPDVTKIH